MARLKSTVRSPKGPRTSPRVDAAVALYQQLWGNYADGTDHLRHDLDFLIERFSAREADAYYDACQKFRTRVTAAAWEAEQAVKDDDTPE